MLLYVPSGSFADNKYKNKRYTKFHWATWLICGAYSPKMRCWVNINWSSAWTLARSVGRSDVCVAAFFCIRPAPSFLTRKRRRSTEKESKGWPKREAERRWIMDWGITARTSGQPPPPPPPPPQEFPVTSPRLFLLRRAHAYSPSPFRVTHLQNCMGNEDIANGTITGEGRKPQRLKRPSFQDGRR